MKECLQVFLDNYIKLENVEAIAVGGLCRQKLQMIILT